MAEPYIYNDKVSLPKIRDERQDSYIPPARYRDLLWEGAKSGFDETTLGFAKDLKLKHQSRLGINLIEQSDWNEQHPQWDDTLEWYDGLTVDIARNVREYRAEQEQKLELLNRTDGWGKAINFGGAFLGAMVDPINIIPIGFAGNTLAKATKVGLTTMAIDASLYAPLAESTEEIRGRDVTINDHIQNAAFAFGAGGALSVLGNLPQFIKYMRSTRNHSNTKRDALNNAQKDMKDTLNQPNNFRIDVNRLSAAGRAKPVSFKAKTSANFIGKLDSTARGVTVYVDERGLMYKNAGDNRVRLDITDDGIVVRGDKKVAVKLLPTITSIAPESNIRIIGNDGVAEVLTPETAQQRITELLQQENITSTSLGGDDVTKQRVEIGDKKYDLEFDEITGEVVAGYEVVLKGKKDPQWRARTKPLSQEDLDALVNAFEQDTINWQNTTNTTARGVNETADAVNDSRSGAEKLNANADRVETKLNETGNEDIAIDTIKGKAFMDAKARGDIVAMVLANPIISETTLKEVGFRIVKQEGVRRLVPIKDFNPNELDEFATALRKEIQELVDYARTVEVEKTGRKDLSVCMLNNGAGVR